MSALNLITDDRLRFECQRLSDTYGGTLTKLDLQKELGVSGRKIDTMVTDGSSPRFKRLGDKSSCRIVFFVYDVATWIIED